MRSPMRAPPPPPRDDDDELTRALRVVRRAGTLVDVLRRVPDPGDEKVRTQGQGGQGPQEEERPLAATGRRMRAVEACSRGGWLLTSWWEMCHVPPMLAREQMVDAIAAVVDRRDTPCALAVARAQMAPYEDAEVYRYKYILLNSVLNYIDRIARVAELPTLMHAVSRWPAADEDWIARRRFTRRVLEAHFGVHDVDVSFVALFAGIDAREREEVRRASPPLANASEKLCYVTEGTLRSPQGAIRIVLRRSPLFQSLPADVFDGIVDAATATRENMLHRVLASGSRKHCSGAVFLRKHMRECLAASIALVTCYNYQKLYDARSYFGNACSMLDQLKRLVRRRERQQEQGKREETQEEGRKRKREQEDDPLPPSGGSSGGVGNGGDDHGDDVEPPFPHPVARLPALNTLVVCTGEMAHAFPRTTQTGLTVRCVSGRMAPLSTALHADVVVVKPSSFYAVAHLSFRRCILFAYPTTHEPSEVRRVARNVWVVRMHEGGELRSSPFCPMDAQALFGYPPSQPRFEDASRVAVALPSLLPP